MVNEIAATSQRQGFQHTPLSDPENQVRLIKLQPGTRDDPIECQLLVVDRASLSDFEAISYTWGNVELTRSLLVDGKSFLVRENCWKAIHQARVEEHPTLLWLDAICIDQDNSHEKSYQVQGIAGVFRRAKRVLISLGDCFYNSEYLFERLYALYIATKVDDSPLGELPKPSKNVTSRGYTAPSLRVLAWLKAFTSPSFNTFWEAFTTLASHPYWTRLWVHPELVLATEAYICVGTIVCHLNVVIKTMQLLHDLAWSPEHRQKVPGWSPVLKQQSAEVQRIHNHLNNVQRRDMPMWKMLNRVDTARRSTEYLGGCPFRELCELHCSDPRDRVFALLPLVDWKNVAHQPIVVGYEESKLGIAWDSIMFCRDLDDVEYLFRSLEIGCEHTDPAVTAYLTYCRQHAPELQLSRLPILRACNHKSPMASSAIKLRFHHFCRITLSSYGLEADFTSNSGGFLDIQHVDGWASTVRFGPRCTVYQKSQNRGPGRRFAVVPDFTSPGDIILLPFGSHFRGPHCGLVARQESKGVYSIIGQAIVATMQQMPFSRTGYELRMNSRDAITHALCGPPRPGNCLDSILHSDQVYPSLGRADTPFNSKAWSSYVVDLLEHEHGKDICHDCGGHIDEQEQMRTANDERSGPGQSNPGALIENDHENDDSSVAANKSWVRSFWRRI